MAKMFYKKHIFFCTNKRADETGCGYLGGEVAFDYTRSYLRSLDMYGEGKFRASKSGCLGRCSFEPVCVIYPDGIWYTYTDEIDVKEIIDNSLLQAKIVKRLLI
jgi:(2Fe-2S) ferredoxin